MAIIAKEPEGNFEQIEAGICQAVCAEVLDLGLRSCNTFDAKGVINGQTDKPKLCIIWELADSRDDGRRFIFSKEYVNSLHEKATLRKDLNAWRGVPFTKEELKGFDVEKVIGANCMLNIEAYEKKGGGEGRKVASVGKLMKGLDKIELSTDYIRPKFINDIIHNSNVDASHPAEQYVDESGLPF
jgi:hypothetical protein